MFWDSWIAFNCFLFFFLSVSSIFSLVYDNNPPQEQQQQLRRHKLALKFCAMKPLNWLKTSMPRIGKKTFGSMMGKSSVPSSVSIHFRCGPNVQSFFLIYSTFLPKSVYFLISRLDFECSTTYLHFTVSWGEWSSCHGRNNVKVTTRTRQCSLEDPTCASQTKDCSCGKSF